MSNEYRKSSILNTAKMWQKEHLDAYIEQLDEQIADLRDFVKQLKIIQKEKQKAIDRKLSRKDTGVRGAT